MALTKVSYSMIDGAPFNVYDYGAVGDGVADDSDAIQEAIDAAALAVGGSTGAVVYFPTGTYLINKTINMPNRVGLQGANGRGVTIKAASPFTGAAMFYAVNGTSSMFGSWINDMYLDSRGINLASAVVLADAWQETCGMTNVVMSFDGTTPYGLLVQIGYGGAAYLPLRDLEIFSDSTVTNAAIRVSQISLVGGFVLSVDGLTAAGTLTNPMDAAIQMVNDSLYVKGLHCEYVDTMIAMNGAGGLSADTCTGSSVPVIDMVAIASGFTGQVNLRNMIPNGASGNIFKNNITGLNIPASEYGILTSYDYQPSAFASVVTAQIPNVTGDGTEYRIVFNSELYDYLGEYNNATGTFTASRSGKYIFSTCVEVVVPDVVTTYVIKLSTSNREYTLFRGDTDNIRDGSGTVTLTGSVIADLDKNDTASVRITVTGVGANTVDVEPNETFFEGHWLSR
jgi:hypothetical protein